MKDSADGNPESFGFKEATRLEVEYFKLKCLYSVPTKGSFKTKQHWWPQEKKNPGNSDLRWNILVNSLFISEVPIFHCFRVSTVIGVISVA